MNKNTFLPLAIIVFAVAAGWLLLAGGTQSSTSQVITETQSLRKVDLEIQNMFCIGCRSSVVNSVLAIPGVVQADADPRTDSGWIIYDPNVITKEEIVTASVFQAYQARIIADYEYSNGANVQSVETSAIPPEITYKLDLLAQRVAARGVVMESFFVQELDDAISGGYWDKANNLLDNYLEAYE